jgi:hypothetical protein
VLRHQLTATGSNVTRHSKRLNAAYPAYRKSLGHHPAPVLKELAALTGAVRHALAAVEGVHLTTGAGHRTKGLVVSTLTTLEAGLTDLRRAFSARDRASAQRALRQAQARLKQCEQLRVQASQALGFTWRP